MPTMRISHLSRRTQITGCDRRRRKEEQRIRTLPHKVDDLSRPHQLPLIIPTINGIRSGIMICKSQINTEEEATKKRTNPMLPLKSVANPPRNVVRNLVLAPLHLRHILIPPLPTIPSHARNSVIAVDLPLQHPLSTQRPLKRLNDKHQRINSITGSPLIIPIEPTTQIENNLSLVGLLDAGSSYPIRSGYIQWMVPRSLTPRNTIRLRRGRFWETSMGGKK